MLHLYLRICHVVVLLTSLAYSYVDNDVGMMAFVITCIMWVAGKVILEGVEAGILLGFFGNKKE